MKRLTSLVIMMAMIVGLFPAASAAEPGRSWEEVARQCEDLGLEIIWYPEYEGLMRRYGTDRMLLVQGGKSYLYSLRGNLRLAGPFDAFDYFNGSGLAPACQGWKWGIVNLDGETVVNFTYATKEEAAAPIAHFVSRWADGSAPYALADAEGKLLTEYKYWQYRPFSWGLAAVTDGASWGYVDERGREVVPCRYGEVYDFQPNGRARVYYYEGRRSNFIDGAGREMLEAPSDYTSLWDAGQGLWGLGVKEGAEFYNDQGELVVQVPCSFRSSPKGEMMGNVFDGTGTASFYSEDGTWKEVTIPVGEDGLHEGLYRVQDPDSGLWGFENGEKELVVPAVFDTAGYFDHGVAVVRSGDTFGLLENPLLEDGDARKVSDWAIAEVTAATEAGYVTPRCSTYQTHTITRLQFAELAVNYLEKATGETIVPAPMDTFTDTTDETVLKAYAAGIVQGVGEGRFDPGGLLTREQLATMLWRAMEQVGAGWHVGSLDEYVDADQISDWAGIAMNNLIHHNVMAGTGENTLSPKASCTVEQAILLVYRAAGKEYTLPSEQEAQRQAAIDRVTIQGLAIGTPFDELPADLRRVLEPQGEPYDGWPSEPGKEIARRYTAPDIEIITSEATEKVLKRALEGQSREYLLEQYGSEDWQEVYAKMLGREYVDTIILTGDNYQMVSGLKVGDSAERVQELGYSLGGELSGLGAAILSVENGVVTQINVYDYIGRRVGPFFDP